MLSADEECPIRDQMLGEMYRASPHGLRILIDSVEPNVRARLAIYCYRRAHLESIGLAIAATCEKDNLTAVAGSSGAILFHRSREAPPPRPTPTPGVSGRKVSLSTGPLRNLAFVEEEDE